jgi:hypothetical protein
MLYIQVVFYASETRTKNTQGTHKEHTIASCAAGTCEESETHTWNTQGTHKERTRNTQGTHKEHTMASMVYTGCLCYEAKVQVLRFRV